MVFIGKKWREDVANAVAEVGRNQTQEDRLVEMIGEFFDLRPSEARKVFENMRNHVIEISNWRRATINNDSSRSTKNLPSPPYSLSLGEEL